MGRALALTPSLGVQHHTAPRHILQPQLLRVPQFPHVQHSVGAWLCDGRMYTLQKPSVHSREVVSGLEGDLFH